MLPLCRCCAYQAAVQDLKLRGTWHDLHQKFLKKRKARSSSTHRATSDSGGGRSSLRNSLDVPRSSPRDMGVVRSDMEMEEIIARLEAEEAAQSRFERNLATIPAQILDAKEKRARRFIDSNSLVLDPVHEVRLHALATTWQEAEKKIFLEKCDPA